jgi:glutamine amidotransferase
MIAIIDYGMGNVTSVLNALHHVGAQAIITRETKSIADSDKLILPGVGAFSDGIKNLRFFGLDDILSHEVLEKKKPILGICLGMQLLCNESYEFGHNFGLGWIDASVVHLPEDNNLRIPHIGWNNISITRTNPLITRSDILDFYFVHSFHVVCNHVEDVIATCTYGVEFVASFMHDNIFATQFHPEKSQEAGLSVLRNFMTI